MQSTKAAQGLIALVTGANRGIGLETSRQLAAQGATVMMAGRDLQSTEAAARALQSDGLKVVAVTLDVANPTHIETLRAKIASDYGRLDILINNAGIITGESFMENSAQTISQEALRQTFEVNFFAPIALTQALLPLLKAAPAARIVNLTSILGSLTLNSDPNSPIGGSKALAYNASKAAINLFTINLAQSLQGTNIKVNAAHPGWVKTDMGSQHAPMEIPDGAKTSVALALIGPDGPNGRFIHLGDELPW